MQKCRHVFGWFNCWKSCIPVPSFLCGARHKQLLFFPRVHDDRHFYCREGGGGVNEMTQSCTLTYCIFCKMVTNGPNTYNHMVSIELKTACALQNHCFQVSQGRAVVSWFTSLVPRPSSKGVEGGSRDDTGSLTHCCQQLPFQQHMTKHLQVFKFYGELSMCKQCVSCSSPPESLGSML